MKKAQPFVLACAIAACVPSTSFALGIRIADQDAAATARGNAFTATADNPSAIYYNPAGISQLYAPSLNSPACTPTLSGGKGTVPTQQEASGTGGLQVRLGLYGITLGNEVNLSGGRGSLDISHRWQVAGSFYATWKNEKSPLTFGLGIYSPYGFGVWYPENSPLRLTAISGSIAYTSINPVVSWQVTDTLSIAAGPTINYAKTGLKRGIPFPGTNGAALEFEGTGWALGANAGILWRPLPQHSFGLMYRSETQVNFDGHSNTYIPGFLSYREAATANIVFPQNIVLGYSYRPTPKWNFEVNVDWTDWDRLNTVTLNRGSGNVPLPFNWQSSFFYEFGATYKFDSGFTASVGYIYSENSVPDGSFNPIVPDSNRHIFSTGFGKQFKNWNFDLAYQYAFGPTRSVTQGAPSDGTYSFNSNAISISAGYRF